MRRVRVRRREGERGMKIAPLAARCACGRTGPAALAPLFRDNIRATTMTTAATPPTAAMELHTTVMIITCTAYTAQEKFLFSTLNKKNRYVLKSSRCAPSSLIPTHLCFSSLLLSSQNAAAARTGEGVVCVRGCNGRCAVR